MGSMYDQDIFLKRNWNKEFKVSFSTSVYEKDARRYLDIYMTFGSIESDSQYYRNGDIRLNNTTVGYESINNHHWYSRCNLERGQQTALTQLFASNIGLIEFLYAAEEDRKKIINRTLEHKKKEEAHIIAIRPIEYKQELMDYVTSVVWELKDGLTRHSEHSRYEKIYDEEGVSILKNLFNYFKELKMNEVVPIKEAHIMRKNYLDAFISVRQDHRKKKKERKIS